MSRSQSSAPPVYVNGLLLLYHRPPLRKDAVTVSEHIEAFQRHSKFKVWSLNTAYGCPPRLGRIRFSGMLFHYSLFGGWIYYLNDELYDYIDACESTYKVAFFQDEYRYCRKRFAFVDRCKVDCVYTLLRDEYFAATYQKYTHVAKLVSHLPGYVSAQLINAASRFMKSEEGRTIDIGYRGRKLDYYMGKGAQEKHAIAVGFRQRLADSNLRLDVECEEQKRIYGDGWYRFLADCRAVLGVEAGVSVFDVEDVVRPECERLLQEHPHMTFDEIYTRVLWQWEDRISYRTISPRHFEAGAFHACQILFEGHYSGILKPWVHYIPLKEDFSNFDEVMGLLYDRDARHELTEQAHHDLIASGRYSYERFIADFDAELEKEGVTPRPSSHDDRVTSMLGAGLMYRKARAIASALNVKAVLPTRLRKLVKPALRPLLNRDGGFDVEPH